MKIFYSVNGEGHYREVTIQKKSEIMNLEYEYIYKLWLQD